MENLVVKRIVKFGIIFLCFFTILEKVNGSGLENPAVIYPDDTSACVLSPYNWASENKNEHAVKSWNNGAYARFYVINCSAPLTLNLTNGNVDVRYSYQVDNGPLSAAHGTLISTGKAVSIILPDKGPHTITVHVHEVPQVSGRFAGKEFLAILNLTLPAGGMKGKALRKKKNMLLFGDSITEGIFADDWSGTIYHSNLYSWAHYVAEAFAFTHDFEYGMMACGGGGYSVTGAGECPPAITVGDEANTWWNKINSSTSQLNSQGLFIHPPDIIIENWGVNDSAAFHNGKIYEERIVSLWTALRKAAPKALIVKLYTFLGFYKTDIQAAVALYSLKKDPNFKTIDLQVEDRRHQYGDQADPYYAGVHPGTWGHAVYGNLITSQVQKFWDQSSPPIHRPSQPKQRIKKEKNYEKRKQ